MYNFCKKNYPSYSIVFKETNMFSEKISMFAKVDIVIK